MLLCAHSRCSDLHRLLTLLVICIDIGFNFTLWLALIQFLRPPCAFVMVPGLVLESQILWCAVRKTDRNGHVVFLRLEEGLPFANVLPVFIGKMWHSLAASYSFRMVCVR